LKKQYTTILIVPCFNEALRISVTDYLDFATRHPDHLLLFVNDGSTDKTEDIIRSMLSQAVNLDVHTYPANQGKGEAVRNGVQYALDTYQFTYIGFVDADLSTPLSEFLSLQNVLEHNPPIKIAMGARVQMLGKNIKRNLFRHWFSRIIATLICKVLDEPVYDTQCGAKLFTQPAAADLFKEKFLSKWLFDVELLARHKRKYGDKQFKTTVVEMPVSNWTEKEDSKLRYHHVFRILFDLFKINKHYF
jgi:glycosyltransferase involved in cell wall biosynthesis